MVTPDVIVAAMICYSTPKMKCADGAKMSPVSNVHATKCMRCCRYPKHAINSTSAGWDAPAFTHVQAHWSSIRKFVVVTSWWAAVVTEMIKKKKVALQSMVRFQHIWRMQPHAASTLCAQTEHHCHAHAHRVFISIESYAFAIPQLMPIVN